MLRVHSIRTIASQSIKDRGYGEGYDVQQAQCEQYAQGENQEEAHWRVDKEGIEGARAVVWCMVHEKDGVTV